MLTDRRSCPVPTTARVIPPPVVFAVALLAAGVMTWLEPWPVFHLTVFSRIAGGVLIAAGLALSAWMMLHFHRARTPVSPLSPTRALVMTGPYRFSRNPDYLGQSLVFIGVALALNSVWMLFAFVPAILVVRYSVIAREEAYLQALFGEEYRSYQHSVRRWL